MDCTMTSWLVRWRPRQFIEMWENSRCSILFHFDVPGGRWHTVMVRPVSAANAASSVFHSRVREPLDPPPSAVISSRDAFGQELAADCHQRRIVATANAAVSWSVPTLTQPVFAPRSYTPYGLALPRVGSMKSWTLTCSGSPAGCHSLPPFLYGPTSSPGRPGALLRPAALRTGLARFPRIRLKQARADPLPQTPYVLLDGPPTNGVPVQGFVLRSVHHRDSSKHRRWLRRHDVQLALRFRPRCQCFHTGPPGPRQHPFGSGHSSRIRPVIPRAAGGGADPHALRFPVAFRRPALASRAIRYPPGNWAFLTVDLPGTDLVPGP